MQADDLVKNYAQFLIECCLIEYTLIKWKPSLIAASSIFLAKKILKQKPAWSTLIETVTGFKETDLR